MDELKPHGLYLISDAYHERFPSAFWLDNKSETRPHYYAVFDERGLMWMIPLSSSVEKYRRRIDSIEEKAGIGRCYMYFIGQVQGRASAFDIRDMFPVTPEYVVRAYMVGNQPYRIKSQQINKALESKALRFLHLLNTGRTPDRNGVLAIAAELLEKAAED